MTIPSDRRGSPAGDHREALYNEGAVGPAADIQIPTERITRLNGLLLDLDPDLLAPGNSLFPPAGDPRGFFDGVVAALDRHPLLRSAEVRSSGGGLHVVLRFDPPVELASAADQKRWSTLVRAVQASVPADPRAPGITALTRPIGSVNSKNGAVVEQLRPGQAVDPARVESFVRELEAAPFRVVAAVLLGGDRIEPCPVCRKPGSSLGVLDRHGHCYRCGPVSLERLYELVYRAIEDDVDAEDEADGQPSPRSPRSASKRPAAVAKPRSPRRKDANRTRRTSN
jgi:hypothetical protein